MKKIFLTFLVTIFFLYGIFSCAYSDKENNKSSLQHITDTLKVDTIWISAVGDLMCHDAQLDDARKSNGEYSFSHMFD